MNLLRRIGNKSRLADTIIKFFPEHELFIEPFFGAGGLFLKKPKAKYNILNDIDDDVFNFFTVIQNRLDELYDLYIRMPVHESLFKYWKKNTEKEPVTKALRFLFLSNHSLYGMGGRLRFGLISDKKAFCENAYEVQRFLSDVQFMNCDFRVFLKKISFRSQNEKDKSFVYIDAPYVNTNNNYSHSFTLNDFADLLDVATESGLRTAISEFYNEDLIRLIKERKGLKVIPLVERRALQGRRKEILIVNYL